MIKKTTVLILGAGASMPFGFPSGKQLVKEILKIPQINNLNKRKAISKLLDSKDFGDFIKALKYSGKTSIDAFLEHRPDFTRIGKLAIATVLISFESEDKIYNAKTNWYSYLLKHINSTWEDFGINLSIVTYNYDRSLEYFLINSLTSTYNKTYHECCEKLTNELPIIHIHGNLGDLPGFGENVRDYSKDFRYIEAATDNIKIIHEDDIANQPQLQQAKELIMNAEVISFLGFGYDEITLNRLIFDDYRKSRGSGYYAIYGTTYKMGQAEIDEVTHFFESKELIFEGKSQTIDEYLKENPIIIQ